MLFLALSAGYIFYTRPFLEPFFAFHLTGKTNIVTLNRTIVLTSRQVQIFLGASRGKSDRLF